MRITPIKIFEVSFKNTKKKQEVPEKTQEQLLEEITVESIAKEAQDRYIKEHQEMYEEWQKAIARPQKYQKEEGKVNDKKGKRK